MGQSTWVAESGNDHGSAKKTLILDAIRDDLRFNRLVLPALPEIALRMRKTVDDPAATAEQMARVIGAEPAISARLLQVANATLYRGRTAVHSVQAAIARLGIKMVRNLVCALVMEQLYKVRTSEKIRQTQIGIWKHSVRVAALSSLLAGKLTNLSKDEAMLGGLVHDIGKLPILTRAASVPGLAEDGQLLQTVLGELHIEIGNMVLSAWRFPEALVRCIDRHEQYDDSGSQELEICDVVTLANLCSHPAAVRDGMIKNFDSLPALRKLEIDAKTLLDLIAEVQPEVREIEQLLHGS